MITKMECGPVLLMAVLMLVGCGKRASEKDSTTNTKQLQVAGEKQITSLCTISKAFEVTMPQSATLVRLAPDQTKKGERNIKLYIYTDPDLIVVDNNENTLARVILGKALNVWVSKNGQTIKAMVKGPSNDYEDITTKVFDGNGNFLFKTKRGGISQISDDGQYILIGLAEHPMEAIEIHDRKGNLLWTKGSDSCVVWGAKIIKDNIVLTVERAKNGEKNSIVIYDINGNLQFTYPNIKPEMGYSIYTGGSMVMVSTQSIYNSIYTVDIKGYSVTTLDSTKLDLQTISDDGKYCLLAYIDTLVCWEVSKQKELWKLAGTNGRGKISPSGKWFVTYASAKSKNEKYIKLVDRTGKIVYETDRFVDFINDSMFYYQDNNKIVFNNIGN
ncbi:MAG: hypothetical protein RDU76_01105 [Candidatus Edwardsbacteria bacterium]|nr:hypothetical protein [Candidatus Edwardsbacteria bacterium]